MHICIITCMSLSHYQCAGIYSFSRSHTPLSGWIIGNPRLYTAPSSDILSQDKTPGRPELLGQLSSVTLSPSKYISRQQAALANWLDYFKQSAWAEASHPTIQAASFHSIVFIQILIRQSFKVEVILSPASLSAQVKLPALVEVVMPLLVLPSGNQLKWDTNLLFQPIPPQYHVEHLINILCITAGTCYYSSLYIYQVIS